MSLFSQRPAVFLAKAILRNRGLRRKMLFQLCGFLLLLVVVGHWVLGAWLQDKPVLFLLWWAGVLIYMLLIVLLALYDMLRVIKEEKDKLPKL